jgi:hypothetical protein
MTDRQANQIIKIVTDIATAQGAFQQSLNNIVEHLSKLNGSTGKNSDRIESLELGLVSHAKDCPLIGKVINLEKVSEVELKVKEETKKWKEKYLIPTGKFVVKAIVVVGTSVLFAKTDILEKIIKLL